MEHQKELGYIDIFQPKPTEDIDYKALLHKYFLSKWYLYLLFLLLGLGLADNYIDRIEPEYLIRSKLLIKENRNKTGTPEDWLRRSLNFSATSENIANEIQILGSFSLMHSIVKEMGLGTRYYWQNKWIKRQAYKEFPLTVDSFKSNAQQAYNVAFQIIPIDRSSFQFVQDSVIGVYQFGQSFKNKYGSFRIQVNRPFSVESDTSYFVQFADTKAIAKQYVSSLKVRLSDKHSTMLELSLQDASPQRGIDVLSKLIEQYQQLTYKENNSIARNTLEFIDGRLENVSGELKNIEKGLERYKQRNEIASKATSDLDIMFVKANQLSTEEKELELQLSILGSMQNKLNIHSDEFELVPANLYTDNSSVSELIHPYNDLVLERKQMLKTAKPSHPLIMTTGQKLADLRYSIFQAIDNIQQDLLLKKQMITRQYNRSSDHLQSVPGKERKLLEIERQKSITENLYVYLLQKKEETALALMGGSSNSRLIDPPDSSNQAISPKTKVIYLGGILGGFVIPFLFISLQDFYRSSIQNEEELRSLLPNQDIIGVINQNRGKKRQVILRHSRSMISERFRSLRVHLLLNSAGKQQSILVTSSTSVEGKTFVATNLAISFALAYMKTIIVDFDLRDPKMASYLNGKNDIGLSNYLIEYTDVEKIIQVSDIDPNLHYIASGPIPYCNPAELFGEQKLNKLFSYLKANYDIIILDTPPIGAVSDVIYLRKFVNNSLFVVRPGITTKAMLENAKAYFKQDKLTNPSLILNGVKKEKEKVYKNYLED